MKLSLKGLAVLLAAVLLLPLCLASCSGNDYAVVMEYNGITLTEDMYNYWMATFKRNILSSYSDAYDTEAFWSQPYDEEQTVEEYFTEIIHARIVNYLVSQDLYKKNRLTMSDSTKQAIKDDIKEKIEYYGSRSALNAELSTLMLNVQSLQEIYTWEEKHNTVYQWMFGEGGVNEISNADLIKYYEETYSRIQYIVFYTTKIKTDDDGNYVYDSNGNVVTEDMTAEELAEKKAKIAECQAKIDAGTDFETLRKEYSEFDTSSYPNGFFISANELDVWGVDIVLGAKNASVGKVFMVEEETAVFLVKKCALTPFADLTDADLKQLSYLSTYATQELYDRVFAEFAAHVTVYDEILAKYKLSTIRPNPYYSI
ncbi:MAG: hypothetical protein E7618_06615 [Ruminococcaceae bacterium]|nr:hypothetical protein [Oscillospiraceae bacterium]